MKKIRNNVFETNSSSTHSITMCMESDVQDWKDGKKFYIRDIEAFISLGEELNKYLNQMVINDLCKYDDGKWYKGIKYTYQKMKDGSKWEYLDENGNDMYSLENLTEITQEQRDEWLENCDDNSLKPMSYDEYWDSLEYETYEETFTTPSGEKVVAFGYYGNDY